MICKYCNSEMMHQGRDSIGRYEYGRLYVCPSCKSVFDQTEDVKGNVLRKEWWNNKTKQFEK